jgi:hypothetical protein
MWSPTVQDPFVEANTLSKKKQPKNKKPYMPSEKLPANKGSHIFRVVLKTTTINLI